MILAGIMRGVVAVKILHSHLSEDQMPLERFRAEAQAVAAMRHPNIVQVFDFDIADGCLYILRRAAGVDFGSL